MGLRDAIASLVRWLLRVGQSLFAVGTLAGYVWLWYLLRQPEVTFTSPGMPERYRLVIIFSGGLAVLVLVETYLEVSGTLGGLVPGLPSRSSSGGSSSSTLSTPNIGGGDDSGGGYGSEDDGGSRFGSDDDDSGSSEGSILGPHN